MMVELLVVRLHTEALRLSVWGGTTRSSSSFFAPSLGSQLLWTVSEHLTLIVSLLLRLQAL